MKQDKRKGQIQQSKTKRQWQLYQQINELAEIMSHLPDAEQAKRDRLQSVPAIMLPMVF